MTPADITTLRTRACALIASLGDVLDSLTVIEQTAQTPGDDFADAVVVLQHLDEAHSTASDLCEAAHTLSLGIQMSRELQIERVEELERGK